MKTWIWAVLGVVVLGGGAYLFIQQRAASMSDTQNVSNGQIALRDSSLYIGLAKQYPPNTPLNEREYQAFVEFPIAKGYTYPNVGDGINYGDGKTIPATFKGDAYTIDYGDGTIVPITFKEVLCTSKFCTADFYVACIPESCSADSFSQTHNFSKQGTYSAILYRNGNKILTKQFEIK